MSELTKIANSARQSHVSTAAQNVALSALAYHCTGYYRTLHLVLLGNWSLGRDILSVLKMTLNHLTVAHYNSLAILRPKSKHVVTRDLNWHRYCHVSRS